MDTKWIVEKAKTILFETGEMPSMLFVETDHMDTVGLGLANQSEDAKERVWEKFLAGRFFALKTLKKKATRKRVVTGLCQVDEVWFGEGRGRRVGSTNEKEGLMIVTIDVITLKQQSMLYELIRDGSGSVIDLLDQGYDKAEEIRGAGLPAFLAGFKTAKQPQGEAIHEFRRVCEQHMAYTR